MKKRKYSMAFAALIWGGMSAMAQEQLPQAADNENEWQTQAVSTISGDELEKNSAPNVTNLLNGLMPGLMVKQNTGWTDNAEMVIRGGGSLNGGSPLVIVDGVPRELQYLNTLEIESIQILKDGPATAMWGLRGSNGVIVVKTKRGKYHSKKVGVNYTYGIGLPINQPEFVDGYTYALMKNEALRYDGLSQQYDQTALDAFRNGSNPDLYANTDWIGEAQRSHTVNNQLNIDFRGGGNLLRYYALVNYKNDYGILDKKYTNLSDRFDAQMKKYDLSARINLDVDITKHTLVTLSMFGLLHEENRPRTTEANIFSYLYHTPSAAYPIRMSSGVWGGSTSYPNNPIASIADVGYFKTNRRLLQSTLNIRQDLSMLTKGLSAEVAVAYDNDAVFQETGTVKYEYNIANLVRNADGGYETVLVKQGENVALSISNSGLNSQYMRAVLEGKIGYDRSFGKHSVSGLLHYWQQAYTPMGRNNSRKRQSYIFSGSYGYDNRYLLDVVVNRSGTSLLSDGDKFRTYPALSAAWMISNEAFMKNQQLFDYLKLRASWGRSGNDNISYDLDERFWVNTTGYLYGSGLNSTGGLIAGALAIDNLDIERADKYNVGLDVQMLKKRLNIGFDLFLDQRRNILTSSGAFYSGVLGTTVPQQNVGSVDTKGMELSLMWKDQIGKHFNYYISGNVSTVKTEIKEDGQGYQPYDYLYHTGNRLGQIYGLEAIGYFRDDADIASSPRQVFSEVRPGDIKYKDQNNDNKIDDYDIVPIGHSSSMPGLYGGLSLGFEYKGFGVDMTFQGVTKYSRMLNTKSVYWPLRNGNSNLSTWYLKDRIRWTEETKDIANVPRLTTLDNANNFRSSTQWLADASYFKLRNLNIYYNLPQKWIKSMKMEKCQIYVRGNNLFSLDHVKYMNCEDFSINYPDLMSLYVGLNINF